MIRKSLDAATTQIRLWMRSLRAKPNRTTYRRITRLLLERLEDRVVPTVSWTGGGDGTSWNEGSNWSTGQVPGTGDDVLINLAGAIVTYSSGSTTVNSITNDDTLKVEGGSLSTTQFVQQNNGTLQVDAGTLSAGTGIFVNSGTLNYNGGTLSGGETLADSALNLGSGGTGAASFLCEGADTLSGNVAAGQTLLLQGNGTYTNATLTDQGNVTNDGTIQLDSINSSFNETLDTGAFTLTNAADGTIQITNGNGGNRAITGTLTNQGQINVDSSSLLTIQGTYNAAGGTISGPGYLYNATLNETASPSAATTILIGGTGDVLASNNLANTIIDVQANDIWGDSTLTVGNNVSNAGTIEMDSINSGHDDLLATGSNTLTNAAGGVIHIIEGNGGNRSITGTLANQGQINVDDNTLLTIQGAYDAAGGVISGPGYLINATLTVTASPAAGTTILVAGAGDVLASNNLAKTTILVQGDGNFGDATLTVDNGLSNEGTILLQPDSIYRSDTLSTGSGTFTNAAEGIIHVSGECTITGTVANAGAINVDGGLTLALGGSNWINTGKISLSDDTLDLTGMNGNPFTNASHGVITFDITSNYAAITAADTITNRGTINIEAANVLYLENGLTLNNAAGGKLNFTGDGSISQSNGGNLVNAGLVEKTKGTGTTTISTSSLNNTGTVEVKSGAIDITAPVTQVAGSTLTAGSWMVVGSAKVSSALTIGSAGNLTTIGSKAHVTLNGLNTTFSNLGGLATIDKGGSFSLLGGQSFSTGGTLTNNGSLTLGPGDVLTVGGSYSQSSTGTLAVQLGGTSGSPTFGQLVSTTGSVSLAGNFKVTSTVVPAVGSSFNVLDNEGNATIGGTFAKLAEGTKFTVKKGGTSMTFQISYVGNDGDGGNNVVLTRTA